MVCHHVQVNLSDRVVRCHQLGFCVPGQVAAGQESELAKRHQHADALRVIGSVFGLRLMQTRMRIRGTFVRDDFAAGSDNLDVKRRLFRLQSERVPCLHRLALIL